MNNSGADASVLVQSDRLCDEFEQQFRRGESPRIADYLMQVAESHRLILLCDLVALEIHLLGASGEPASVDDFLQRYDRLCSAPSDLAALRATIEKAVASRTPTVAPGLQSTVTHSWHSPQKRKDPPRPQIDGFDIEGVLGRGGMGVVFKAIQTSLRRPVALKMILDADAAAPERFDRFEREATAVAALNDPQFVQIYEFGQAGGQPYMALELLEGGSLAERIHGEPQPAEFAAHTVEILARAMHKAHTVGLIHRDLKPQNVLLAADGTPKIGDFGLVKRQAADDSLMTQQGHVLGTASYMAPEQTYSAHDVGPAADIYALGGILYCLLTGRPPFLGATSYDTILAVRTTEVVPPSRLRPGTPRDLEVICLACLEKEPKKRYATAADLAADLRRYLDGKPITRRPVSAPERAWRWSKRNPLGATVAGLVVAIAVIASVMSWQLTLSNNRLAAETKRANNEAERATLSLENEQLERKRADDATVLKSVRYNLALITFKNVLTEASRRLRNNKQEVVARKEIYNVAMDGLRNLLDRDHPSTAYDRAIAVNYQSIGDLFFTTGDVKKALELYDWEFQAIAATLRKEPTEPLHVRNLAATHNKRGAALERLGQALEAREEYREALRLRLQWDDKLMAQKTYHLPAKTAIAKSHVELATINRLLGDAAAALDHLHEAQQWYGKAPLMDLLEELCDLDNQLGKTYSQLGNYEEAERVLTNVKTIREDIYAKNKTISQFQQLCRAHLELGDYFLMAPKNAQQAWMNYKPALAGYALLWNRNQNAPGTRAGLANIEYRLGTLLMRARDEGMTLKEGPDGSDPMTHFEVSRMWRQELADIDPDDMQAKIELALALARCGRAKEAAERATELQSKGQKNPRLLSQAAMVFALCTEAADKEIADRCRERAYEVLDQLIKAGWKDRAVLRDDPDLDPIRKEPRFQEILNSLGPPGPPSGSAAAVPATSKPGVTSESSEK